MSASGKHTGETPTAPSLLKIALDLGPLLLFFAVNALYGIFAATATFMATTVVSLSASRLLTGKFAMMPLVTAVFVIVFGGLTLWLHNETFIKIKPTVIYLLFAAVLMGGLALNRVFLHDLLHEALDLTPAGWRMLTRRWAVFFVVLALLNEAVWRNVSTDAWVSFKVFGLVPLTFVFAALQVGLIQRNARSGE